MSEGVSPPLAEMATHRRMAELEQQNAQLTKEAIKRRKQVQEFRSKLESTEKAASGPLLELERLKSENRTLKLRGEYEGAASELGVKSGKARDTLYSLLGDAKEGEMKARIAAAKEEHDYLFEAAPTETSNSPARPPVTPASRPGPGGTGRGATADGTGAVKVRKSDLQSFDPRVNPMLDRNRAAEIESAKKAGKLVYLDE